MTAAEAGARILKSTAPGQFDAVADNIQKLGKDSLGGTKWLDKCKEEHNEFMCIGIDNPSAVSSHPLASTLRDKLKSYQDEVFGSKTGVSARIAMTKGESNNDLIVHTYAEKNDTSNQYTGCWKATWTISASSKDNADISGTVFLHTYSYEDGNHQLRTTKEFDKKSVKGKGGDDDASDAIVTKIKDFEMDVLMMLQELREQKLSEDLKMIRRVLPISKTKMKWDVVAHRNVKVLTKTSTGNKK